MKFKVITAVGTEPITPANNASAGLMAAVCILGSPAVAPTPNPPV